MQKSKPVLRGGISHGPYGTKEPCYATKHPLMLTSVLVLAYMIFSGFFWCVLSMNLHPSILPAQRMLVAWQVSWARWRSSTFDCENEPERLNKVRCPFARPSAPPTTTL